MAKLEDYRDLENEPVISSAEMAAICAALPPEFWDGVSEMIITNAKRFEKEVRDTTPTWYDLQIQFDL